MENIYSFEITTLVSCKNDEVVFSYVFSVYVFVCPYLQLYEADLRLLQQSEPICGQLLTKSTRILSQILNIHTQYHLLEAMELKCFRNLEPL